MNKVVCISIRWRILEIQNLLVSLQERENKITIFKVVFMSLQDENENLYSIVRKLKQRK